MEICVKRMGPGAQSLSSVTYASVFLVLLQMGFSALMPLNLVYTYRMDYNVVKDNPANVGTTLDLIARDIRHKHLEDYIILLGDSITYSGPGGPYQSVSRYMSDVAENGQLPPVYNLAIPAAQMGDFYTLLLMLDERGISTDHVILNLIYAGFVERDPDPPIVYWLEQDLRRLDPSAYQEITDDLAKSKENKGRPGHIDSFLEYEVYSKIPILRYRDFVRKAIEYRLGAASQVIGDSRPWYKKPSLREDLQAYVYQRQFDPSPLVLNSSNPNVSFLDRIALHQTGKSLIVYMSPLNKELMRREVSSPGFVENSANLNGFLKGMAAALGFSYVDLTDSIPSGQFSDHLHLTSDGYRHLADILWTEVKLENWFPAEARSQTGSRPRGGS